MTRMGIEEEWALVASSAHGILVVVFMKTDRPNAVRSLSYHTDSKSVLASASTVHQAAHHSALLTGGLSSAHSHGRKLVEWTFRFSDLCRADCRLGLGVSVLCKRMSAL